MAMAPKTKVVRYQLSLITGTRAPGGLQIKISASLRKKPARSLNFELPTKDDNGRSVNETRQGNESNVVEGVGLAVSDRKEESDKQIHSYRWNQRRLHAVRYDITESPSKAKWSYKAMT